MSVAENLFMPFSRTGHGGFLVNRKALMEEAKSYLNRFGIEAQPDDLVANISVSDQQLLQIARACTNEQMKVLILDEPTSSLTRVEVERVFKVIRSLLDRDHAIVFISHKMEEVFQIGDDYTVLRNGTKVESGNIRDVTEADLIRAMSGRDLSLMSIFVRPRPPLKPSWKCAGFPVRGLKISVSICERARSWALPVWSGQGALK